MIIPVVGASSPAPVNAANSQPTQLFSSEAPMAMGVQIGAMAAMEAQMEAQQMAAMHFQMVEQKCNFENGITNAEAQFSNGLSDSLKSAAK
ncbi:hypothetical protein AB4Y40_42315 [Paraburkholderia sp. EG287B]|uniref:hypothetical protein n=1 Tax=unclassified Paraburkholderia TaxID=2615204 RepID=UPI0034D1B598